MSAIGSMRTLIRIIQPLYGKDSDGFHTVSDDVLAEILCRMEVKNATEKWSNRADLRDANAIFTFRRIPGITITPRMQICLDAERYDIQSVEDIRMRGMYIQVVAKMQETINGKNEI